jgi:hypothetical protein
LCELLAFAAESFDDPLEWLRHGVSESRWPLTTTIRSALCRLCTETGAAWHHPLCWSQLNRFGLTPHQLNLQAADEFLATRRDPARLPSGITHRRRGIRNCLSSIHQRRQGRGCSPRPSPGVHRVRSAAAICPSAARSPTPCESTRPRRAA